MKRELASRALKLVSVGLLIAGCSSAATRNSTATVPDVTSMTTPLPSRPPSTPATVGIPTLTPTLIRPTLSSSRTSIAATPPAANPLLPGTWLTDPIPTSTESGAYLILLKELYGYDNYGTGDGRADILYSGETGTWIFSPPHIAGGTPVRFVLKGVLDDHYDIALDSYRVKVTVNGVEVFSGFPTAFQHGAPFGTKFANWTTLSVPAAGAWSVSIRNASPLSAAHWIAFDWIELHVSAQERVIEHADCTLGWTRLTAGGLAKVSDASTTPNRVRASPSTADTSIALLYPGSVVKLIEGPVCADGVVFWRVGSDLIPGGVGWTAEGDKVNYFLEPTDP